MVDTQSPVLGKYLLSFSKPATFDIRPILKSYFQNFY